MTRMHSARRKERPADVTETDPHEINEQPDNVAARREPERTSIDLTDYTFEGLKALQTEIQMALAARKQALVEAMRLEIAHNAAVMGISVEEIMGIDTQPVKRLTRHSRGPQAPKYRGPNGEEWSGRGPAPRWMKPFIAKGKTKADFLIGGQENA